MVVELKARIKRVSKKEEDYPLHKSAFIGNVAELAQLIRSGEDVSKQDVHGNTALHLAVMLGHKECVHMLIAHGAPVKLKNRLGWSPLAEAISYGDRQIISSLLRKLKLQSKEQMKSRKPDMIAAMQKLGDYVVDLKWDFTSWVPLVSKILPSDLCKNIQKGFFYQIRHHSCRLFGNACIREYGMMKQKSNLMKRWIFLCQVILSQLKYLQSPLISPKLSQGGFFKEDRSEMVGNYRANFYAINGMSLETRKRREGESIY
ncbi:ANKRD13 [Lepeophtheirus salmonis]|uniref:ANKRD13 n=1 Tax=Lepeophtheirus salmonis TaxID=72036 RepID=A0A7R8CR03_LEPSM|nr:ANKRD13 [Lepeophtheirus salmonis]CAF2898328.1 ANKRD13 [Lepeophtheirus salmonis]